MNDNNIRWYQTWDLALAMLMTKEMEQLEHINMFAKIKLKKKKKNHFCKVYSYKYLDFFLSYHNMLKLLMDVWHLRQNLLFME